MMEIRHAYKIAIGSTVTVVVAVVLVLSAGSHERSADMPAVRVIPLAPAPGLDLPIEPPNGVVTAAMQAAPSGADTVEDSRRRDDEVDDLVRAAVGSLSNNSRLLTWMVSDHLATRFVSAVEAVADGYSPRDELDFATPLTPFYVTYDGSQAVATDATFRRYDLATEILASLDVEGAAAAYRRLLPRLEQIHADLPYARGGLHERVLEAIDHLLETPVPGGPYAVVRGTRTWAFADPGLEGLSGAQRHLLRMGPRNARSVQETLAALREAIEPPKTIRSAALISPSVLPDTGVGRGHQVEP